jgi:hypothetical protein
MAISEESRHHLSQRLEVVLGADEATTLMEHLAPVGWADVATKRDLDGLGAGLRSELAVVRSDLAAGLDRALRGQTWRILTAVLALASLIVAAPHL